MVDDWIAHTPRDILAKNFGVDPAVFDKVPSKFPYILNGTVSEDLKKAPEGTLKGDSSYVFHTYKHKGEPVPGHGGTLRKIDSKNFPISKTIAAAIVELEPKGLRELHWHPNVSPSRTRYFRSMLTGSPTRLRSGCTSTTARLARLSSWVTPRLVPLTSLLVTRLSSPTTAVRLSCSEYRASILILHRPLHREHLRDREAHLD